MYPDNWKMSEPTKSTRHITTVTTSERLLRQVFDDGGRKELTIQQYFKHVMRLFQGLHRERDFGSLDWIKDADAIIKYFQDTYPTKLSMQATGLNPLLVIVRKAFPDDKSLYDVYYARYTAVRKLMDEARPPPQVLTEREATNWKTLDEIAERRVELQRYVNRKILVKSPKELSIEDNIIMIRHLILCLFTYQPAIRNDYSECPIIRFEDIETTEACKTMSGSENYMLEFAKDQFRLVLKDFKTVKHHGPTSIDMSTRCNNVIAESLQVFPRTYLLSRMRSPDKPMSGNYLTKFCSTGLFKDAKVGSCLLRKICVSNLFKDAPSIAERDDLARSMLHTAAVAQKHYEKKYLPCGSKIQF
jgi:hypothetical protein